MTFICCSIYFPALKKKSFSERVKGIITGEFTVPQIEEEFWRAKLTARALMALAAQRNEDYAVIKKKYAYLFHQKAWHESTKCFKSFTAANMMPVSFAAFIASKKFNSIIDECDTICCAILGEDSHRAAKAKSVFKIVESGTTAPSSRRSKSAHKKKM